VLARAWIVNAGCELQDWWLLQRWLCVKTNLAVGPRCALLFWFFIFWASKIKELPNINKTQTNPFEH